MVRQIIVLALVFFAIIGFASAATAPAPSTVVSSSEAPVNNDAIGTTDGSGASTPGAMDGEAVAGSLGSDSTYGSVAASPDSNNGASSLQLSALTGFAAAVAGSFFF